MKKKTKGRKEEAEKRRIQNKVKCRYKVNYKSMNICLYLYKINQK